ncbi:type II secretion system protein, partial [Synechococcus sp. R55.1]
PNTAEPATFINRGVWNGTPLNLGPDAAGAEAWQDSGSNMVTLRLELECAPAEGPSPYLVEIQTYENSGNARVRFATRDDSDLENYDLRYLKPLPPVNKPCQPDPQKALESNQAHCKTCDPIWDRPCPTDICRPVTITQTATLPAGCTGEPPPPRRVTCQPPGASCGAWSEWTPPCTLANGGTRVTQTRRRTCTACGTSYDETQSQTVDCRQTCNYNWGPWTPASCDEVINQIDCGTVKTFDQSKTGYLIADTSSPSCPATKTETIPSGLRCQRNCGPATFAPEAPPKSPLGEWLAVKPNTVELRPAQEVQADPELETVSVHSVAKASTEGVTIALEPQLSPVLEVKAGVPKPPKWPSPAEALQAAFNWMFGEPAYAARNGLKGNLPSQIANPSKEPGIRPAERTSSKISGNPGVGSPDWARQLRRQLLNKDGEIRCGDEQVNPSDGGFWVPGVFRPNFNDRFRYEAYTAASRPSTLRFEDKNGNSHEIRDRDPLFGLDLDPGRQGLEIQPQMVLNPYAWVNEGDTQNYSPSSNYLGGYYIDTKGSEDIRNGLCFYVKPNGSTIQVQIDFNGGAGGSNDDLKWVDVEPFTLDLNKPTTGFARDNPVLGVILDEVTRRPIPIPRFQELASADVNQRRRNDTG